MGKLDRRGGDDAEGALAADEELLQVVAGVVLAQPPQPVPDAAIGQHDLEAQGQLAGIAVAQYRNPAGVGREIAADLAAPLGAEAQREQPVGRGLLQIGKDAAGLDRHREIDRVDCTDMVHAAEGQDDVVPVLGRDPAADELGVAALRHDRQFRLGADPHHRRHLRGRGRADDQPGGAAVEAARLDEIGLLVTRVGDPAARTNHRFDPLDCLLDLHDPPSDRELPTKNDPKTSRSCRFFSSFPRKRESRAARAAAVALDPRFRGGDDNLLERRDSFWVGL